MKFIVIYIDIHIVIYMSSVKWNSLCSLIM